MFKIFMIEDDQQLVHLLADQLHKFGYNVKPVNNFETVRTQFEQYSPHLVLFNLLKFDKRQWAGCRVVVH